MLFMKISFPITLWTQSFKPKKARNFYYGLQKLSGAMTLSITIKNATFSITSFDTDTVEYFFTIYFFFFTVEYLSTTESCVSSCWFYPCLNSASRTIWWSTTNCLYFIIEGVFLPVRSLLDIAPYIQSGYFCQIVVYYKVLNFGNVNI